MSTELVTLVDLASKSLESSTVQQINNMNFICNLESSSRHIKHRTR